MQNQNPQLFDWIDLPHGRVRYVGGAKGRDEPPIEAFAVELFQRVYYGEIHNLFLSNKNDFNLEVVSFGWPAKDWYGTAPVPGLCAAFSPNVLETIQTLVCEAVRAWQTFPIRPFILTEDETSHFQGKVFFREGWALVAR